MSTAVLFALILAVIYFIIDVMAPAIFVDGCKCFWRHLLPHIQDKCKIKAEYTSKILVTTCQATHWRIRPRSELYAARKLQVW